MPSQIEVVNQSLLVLESDPLTSINDSGDAARIARLMWDMSRRFVLRETVFNFSTAYLDLVPDTNAPPHPEIDMGETNGFRLPNDNIRILEVLKDSRPVRFWRVVGRWVYTAESSITIKYTFNAVIGLWDAAAAECLSFYLASKMAMSITQSAAAKKAALIDYGVAKRVASQSSGLEGTSPKLRVEGRLTTVRHSVAGRGLIFR